MLEDCVCFKVAEHNLCLTGRQQKAADAPLASYDGIKQNEAPIAKHSEELFTSSLNSPRNDENPWDKMPSKGIYTSFFIDVLRGCAARFAEAAMPFRRVCLIPSGLCPKSHAGHSP